MSEKELKDLIEIIRPWWPGTPERLVTKIIAAGYRKIDASKLTVMKSDEMGDSPRSAITINDEKPRLSDYKYRWQAIAEAQLAHTKKELGL